MSALTNDKIAKSPRHRRMAESSSTSSIAMFQAPEPGGSYISRQGFFVTGIKKDSTNCFLRLVVRRQLPPTSRAVWPPELRLAG